MQVQFFYFFCLLKQLLFLILKLIVHIQATSRKQHLSRRTSYFSFIITISECNKENIYERWTNMFKT